MQKTSLLSFRGAVLAAPIVVGAGLAAFGEDDTLAQHENTPPEEPSPQTLLEGIETAPAIPASTITITPAIDDFGLREPNITNRETASQIGEAVTGIWDLRSVPSEYERYNATVRITDGSRFCTGSIVELEDYETIEEGVLISTAAHCLIGQDVLTADAIDRSNITVNGLFFDDNGTLYDYEMSNPSDVWVHPNYTHRERGDVSHSYANEDLALVFFRNIEEPEEVKPYRQTVFDSSRISNMDLQTQAIITAGYSVELYGLSIDECNITGGGTWFTSDCNHVPGSSGGPSFPFNNPYEAFAVTSYVLALDDGTPTSNGHNFFTHENLSTVPFIYQDIASEEDYCSVVTAEEGLRLRTGPGTDYRNNGLPLDEGTGLYTNPADVEAFTILDDENRIWTHVEADDGRQGYIAATNPDETFNIQLFEACN